jgi:hypothetical protein
MNRLSILLPALSMVTVCVSCGEMAPSEARISPVNPVPGPVPGPVFESAIVARDESTTVLFGWLAPRMGLPAALTTTFYASDDTLLETVSLVPVQARSGLVYAAPAAPLLGIAQQNVKDAVRAQVGSGMGAQSIYLGQAEGTISAFRSGYRGLEGGGYSGCPHCLAYFLCHCLEELEGVTLIRALALCPVLDKSSNECEQVRELEPLP